MKRYIFVCAFVLLLSGCSNKDLCFVPDCTNRVGYKSMEYCKEHTCTTDGCYGRKSKYDDLCADCANQKEDEIMSSQETLETAKKEVTKYCSLLKSKHSYIKDIKVDEINYEIVGTSIFFDCEVIQDKTTRSGSIRIRRHSNGSFEVKGLMYN